VRFIGVEAGGCGDSLGKHAARFHSGEKSGGGRVGVLQGTMSYVLQDTNGQIATTHSISAGSTTRQSARARVPSRQRASRIYPGERCRSPRRASTLRKTGRHHSCPGNGTCHSACDSPRARAAARRAIIVNLSGRGDKDVQLVAELKAMSRIREKFGELKRSGRGGFIPFITAGDPDLATTERLLIELAKAGADIIELGVPFSDPVADGEVIQRASERALRNGVTVHDALTCARNVRQHIDVPIVLFSYFNPLLQFGPEPFAPAARQAGIDAVLVTDLDSSRKQSRGLRTCFTPTRSDLLVAPTTSEKRLARIAQQAHGFIYAVSRAGVTGERDEMTRDAEALVKRVRSVSDLPVAVGFGISSPEQVRAVWRFADAAVVGSAIVKQIEKLGDSPDLVKHIGEFARSLVAET
jgi:tryptophan synthase, alpha subunit